ncbi:MAG: amidohydrolase [Deinococcus sp.]|nr:amidohydrolase [Deinococcus sp.]
MNAELVIVGGGVRTMHPARPLAKAVAVQGGRIVALGSEQLVRRFIGRRTEILDLRQRCLLPGFCDAHLHLSWYGTALRTVPLAGVGSLAEAQRLLARRVQATPKGQWVRGDGYDANLWGEYPGRSALDQVAPEHPVYFIAKDRHAAWLNTRGLELAGIAAHTPDPAGGRVVRDARGEPTGVLLENAAELAAKAVGPPPVQELVGELGEAIGHLHAAGITAIGAIELPEGFSALQELKRRGGLLLRVWCTLPSQQLEAALALGVQSGLGDETLRLGAVKIYADGSLGSQTAHMLADFESLPGNQGVEVTSPQALQELVVRASQGGLACAIHAIGDRANRQVLDILAETRPLWAPQGLRMRIEHAQLLSPQDVPRLAQLGVIASMQPIHVLGDMDLAERYWGERARYAYAFRSLLDAGTTLAFGSDCPVEDFSPLRGLLAAVTRQRPQGRPWYPQERITVPEVLQAYTLGAAYATLAEQERGTITEGKLADLVVLSRDPVEVPPGELESLTVDYTLVGGQLVYQRER